MRRTYTVQDFVRRVDMKGKVLVSLELPALDPLDRFRSFKVTPRSQVTRITSCKVTPLQVTRITSYKGNSHHIVQR